MPPHSVSVLTVAVKLDRQTCRAATRYSSPVDMTRTTSVLCPLRDDDTVDCEHLSLPSRFFNMFVCDDNGRRRLVWMCRTNFR